LILSMKNSLEMKDFAGLAEAVVPFVSI